MNNPCEEFLSIAHAALAGDPGLATLKVGGDDMTLTISVEHGPLPSKMGKTEYHPAPSFRREDVTDLLEAMLWSRWSHVENGGRPRLRSRDELYQLRDHHDACRSPIDCGAGWYDLLNAVFQLAEKAGIGSWHTYDVKEKYGGLRIAYSASAGLTQESLNRLDRIVEAAEHLSGHICEKCGAPGEIRPGGYVLTLCDEHAGGSDD